MLQLQLLIDGQEVELHDNESVTLTQSLQDVLDISKVFTDYSRTFNIPASKSNNVIFKHFHRPSIIGNSVQAKQDAELLINYKPYKKGRIKLESVEVVNGSPLNYRITFFGNTIQIKDILGDALLSDLNILDVPLTYTADGVRTIMENGKDLIVEGVRVDDAIIYPLISSNARLLYDSTDDTAGTYNMHYGSNNHGVVFDQLKPAIRLHAILLAIEKQFGLEFSADFFSSANTTWYNLYLWLHKQKGGLLPEADSEPQYQRMTGKWENISGNSTAIQEGFTLSNGTGYRNINNFDGKRYLVVSVDAPTGVDYTVKIVGGSTTEYEAEHTGSDDIVTLNDGLLMTKTQDLGSGQQGNIYARYYTIQIKSNTNSTFTVNASVYDGQGDNPKFASATNEVTTVVGTTKTNVLNELPKIKILDFLTSIFKTFNLTSYYVGTEIRVVPLNDWYDESSIAYDITKYVDTDKSEVSVSYPFSKVNFEYEGKDSFFSAYHTEFFNTDWGSLSYNNSADFTSEEYNIKLPFEHHKFEGFPGTTVQWGWSVDQDQEPYLGKPLIFYGVKVESGTPISFTETLGGTRHQLTNYHIPSNGVDFTENTQTIHFGVEMNERTGNNQYNSLFQTYYRNYIEEVFDGSRRIFKYKAFLPLSVISNINLNDRVIIFNDLYKINKLVTNFETNITNLELVNEVQDFDVSVQNIISQVVKTVDQGVVNADSTVVTADSSEIRW